MPNYYVTSNWGIHYNTLSVTYTYNTPPMTDTNYTFGNNRLAAIDLKDWMVNYLRTHYTPPTNPKYYIAISKQGYFKTMMPKIIDNLNTGNYTENLCFDSEILCSTFIIQFLNNLRVAYYRLGGTNPLI